MPPAGAISDTSSPTLASKGDKYIVIVPSDAFSERLLVLRPNGRNLRVRFMDDLFHSRLQQIRNTAQQWFQICNIVFEFLPVV